MNLKLHVWRQKNNKSPGKIHVYDATDVNPNMSFLEMLDVVNGELTGSAEEPIAFEHDCREGICGSCSLMINGEAHGPETGTTTCQLYMRHFKDGDSIFIEPWRARTFPIIKDLITDRSAFDRIIQAGGFISTNSGSAQDANLIPVPKDDAEKSFEAAACIGCGACVAQCKNASPMLFVSAQVSKLAYLPQGQPERKQRVLNMVDQMQKEGFGNCTNQYECEAVCPKLISGDYIAKLNREYLVAAVTHVNDNEHGGFIG